MYYFLFDTCKKWNWRFSFESVWYFAVIFKTSISFYKKKHRFILVFNAFNNIVEKTISWNDSILNILFHQFLNDILFRNFKRKKNPWHLYYENNLQQKRYFLFQIDSSHNHLTEKSPDKSIKWHYIRIFCPHISLAFSTFLIYYFH